MKLENPIVRDDSFTGSVFHGNKRTGELFICTFENGVEVERVGPIPPETIRPEEVQYLPPGWTREGAN